MSCLRTTHRLVRYLCRQGQWAFFLYCERLDGLLDRYLTCLFRQDRAFFLLKPADDRFHIASAQHIPTIPSLVSLAPPVSSPYLDTNKEIDLQATGSLGC